MVVSKSFLDSTRRIVEVGVGGLVARRLGASVMWRRVGNRSSIWRSIHWNQCETEPRGEGERNRSFVGSVPQVSRMPGFLEYLARFTSHLPFNGGK